MRFLLLFLLLANALQGAITEKYVTDAGAGTATGADAANPMSLAVFHDYMVVGGTFTAAAGTRFNLKGPFTSRGTTIDTWVNPGTNTSPIVIRGYGTIITDGYQGRDSNGVLVTTNMPTLTYGDGNIVVTGAFIVVESLQIVSAKAAGVTFTTTSNGGILRSAITNTSSAGSAGVLVIGGGSSIALDCDITLSTTTGGGSTAVNVSGTAAVLDSCLVRVMVAASSAVTTGSDTACVGNTIIGSGGGGFAATGTNGAPYIRSNTIVGCNFGISWGGTQNKQQRVIGNIFTDNTQYGIYLNAATTSALMAYNRTRDNGIAGISGGADSQTATNYGYVTTDTGGPESDFVNYSTKNLQLVPASPAAAAGLKTFPSLGALQFVPTGGAGPVQTSTASVK